MMPIFVQLKAVDGVTPEAMAFAKQDGKLLPPGTWLLKKSDPILGVHVESVVMEIEDMPPHWQDQLRMWGDFGQKL